MWYVKKNLLIFWVLPKNVQSPGESQTSCHGNTLTVSALYPKFIKLSFPIRVNENYAIRYHCCHWRQCWAQPSPNTKWHLDWFSRFCTAHGRETLYFTMGRPFSLFKLLLPMGGIWTPHLIHGSLGPPESSTQTASRLVELFLHSSRLSVSVLYNGPPLLPSKLLLPMGEYGPHLLHGFLLPTEVLKPNGISIGTTVFAGLTTMTDRQTDLKQQATST